jgi:hypothetical protein
MRVNDGGFSSVIHMKKNTDFEIKEKLILTFFGNHMFFIPVAGRRQSFLYP